MDPQDKEAYQHLTQQSVFFKTNTPSNIKYINRLRLQRLLALSGIIGATILPILALSPTVREYLSKKSNYKSDALIKEIDSPIKENTNSFPALLRIV